MVVATVVVVDGTGVLSLSGSGAISGIISNNSRKLAGANGELLEIDASVDATLVAIPLVLLGTVDETVVVGIVLVVIVVGTVDVVGLGVVDVVVLTVVVVVVVGVVDAVELTLVLGVVGIVVLGVAEMLVLEEVVDVVVGLVMSRFIIECGVSVALLTSFSVEVMCGRLPISKICLMSSKGTCGLVLFVLFSAAHA